MKLKSTLTILPILLFINNVYAVSDDAHKCNNAYSEGDYKTADQAAQAALKANPADREALICQGRVASDLGNLNTALTAFQNADKLSSHPLDKAVISLISGHAYLSAKQYEKASASYQNALDQAVAARHQPMARSSHLGLANVQFESKQYQTALNTYMTAQKLDANDNDRGQSYEKIAETYHMLEQHDLALEYQIKAYFMHEKAGTMDQFAHTSIELGRYYLAVKNYARAEFTLNKIIKFARDNGGAYYEAKGLALLAQTKAASGDTEAAKTFVAQAKSAAKVANDAALDAEIHQETQSIAQ
jgi:tetratricopeptide (TPR) repeat protein